MKTRSAVLLLAAATALACGAATPTQPDAPLAVPAGDAAVASGASGLSALNNAPVLNLRTSPVANPGEPYPVVSGKAPLTVLFDLCQSGDPDQDREDPAQGDSLNWQFHFGDDGSEPFGPDGSFQPNAEHVCRADHTYRERGRYTATLSVTDKHLEDQSQGVVASARVTRRLTIDVASADAGGAPPRPGSSPTPTPTPIPAPTPIPCGGDRCVFRSSREGTGNLGGLTGADDTCQALASAAGLPGTYQAWLSDATVGPATRFRTRSSTPYRRVDGALVASDWADLVDGTLANPISLDETGVSVGESYVWTNTTTAGTPFLPTQTCSDWTYGAFPSPSALIGISTETSSNWTNAFTSVPCARQVKLYCFQQ